MYQCNVHKLLLLYQITTVGNVFFAILFVKFNVQDILQNPEFIIDGTSYVDFGQGSLGMSKNILN